MSDFWTACEKAREQIQTWEQWKKTGLVTLGGTVTDPKKTRLVEAVECGLDAQDQETLNYMREHFETYEEIYEDPLDFLDRLPGMIEDRDRELADAEYEILCLKLEVDTIRNHNADLIVYHEKNRRHFQASDDGTVHRLKDLIEFQKSEIRRLRGLLDGESHS